MILRARQRGEQEELQQIDRQFPLDDVDVAQNRFDCVVRKAKNVAGISDHACCLPGQQHLTIFGDLVLPLLGAEQVLRVDILKADEYAPYARPRAFFDEVRQAVAEGIDLDDETDVELVDLPQPDQPIEDGFPLLVASEIVIGNEEAAQTLRLVY